MLDVLRRKKDNPLIAGFLLVIILMFIGFFGPGSQDCSGKIQSYAARVDGQIIGEREYQLMYSMEYRNQQQQFPGYNRDMAKAMKLRERVLDQMIGNKLLVSEAEKHGLAVDDVALREALLADERFQTNGRFDKSTYERILNFYQFTPADFERSMREELLAEKYRTLLLGLVSVPKAEARRALEDEGRSINLAFFRLKAKDFAAGSPDPSPAEVDEFLKKADAEEQIQKHYDRHKRTRYDVPEKLKARHILVRAEKEAPPDVKRAARDKAAEALKLVRDGKLSFEEAAKKYSDDSTKDRGGDLGFFSRGQMVRPFEEAAFDTKVGELHDKVVESPFGFHVIKVEDRQAPVQKKLEDVKKEIALELVKEEKASGALKTRAKEILAAIAAGRAFEDAAKGLGLEVEETGSFTKSRDYIPKIGIDKELSNKVWALTMDKPLAAEPHASESGIVIYKLKERIDPKPSDLEKALAMKIERLSSERAREVYEAWIAHLKSKAKVETNPDVLDYEKARG